MENTSATRPLSARASLSGGGVADRSQLQQGLRCGGWGKSAERKGYLSALEEMLNVPSVWEGFTVPLIKSECCSLLNMPNRDREETTQGGSNVNARARTIIRHLCGEQRCLTLSNEHADFGVQQALRSAAVARDQLEDGQEGANVAQPAGFVLQFLVHGRLVDTLEHVALHLAQGGKHWEQLSPLP